MYPENSIHKNYPDVHWTYHILGYLLDALIYEKVNYTIVLKSMVFRTLLMDKYKAMINTKEIEPIEDIDVTHKLLYWNESAKYASYKDDRILLSKSMYVVDAIAAKFYTT
jgi:hypothetical protein